MHDPITTGNPTPFQLSRLLTLKNELFTFRNLKSSWGWYLKQKTT